MRRVMLLALLAVGLPMAALASSKDPLLINFSVINLGDTPSYTGTTLGQATAFDFGTRNFVNGVGAGDQSGLNEGGTNVIVFSPNPFSFGSGDSGPVSLTK